MIVIDGVIKAKRPELVDLSMIIIAWIGFIVKQKKPPLVGGGWLLPLLENVKDERAELECGDIGEQKRIGVNRLAGADG